jgi:hypothetical protein
VNKLLFFSQELNSKTKAIHDKKERPFEGIVKIFIRQELANKSYEIIYQLAPKALELTDYNISL